MNRYAAATIATLLVWAYLLPLPPSVRAGNITYQIINYPSDQPDDLISGSVTLSGTIITDGKTGVLDSSDFIGGSLDWVSPAGPFQVPFSYFNTNGSIASGSTQLPTATSTELLVPMFQAVDFVFSDGAGLSADLLYVNTRFNDLFGEPYYAGDLNTGDGVEDGFASVSAPLGSPSIFLAQPWVVAEAVPEPASLTLVFLALLGFGRKLFVRGVARPASKIVTKRSQGTFRLTAVFSPGWHTPWGRLKSFGQLHGLART